MSTYSEAAHKAWATRRARLSKTPPAKRLARLAYEQSKWMRRETIARNKLKRIRQQIEEMLEELLDWHNAADSPYAKRKITK